MRATAKRHVGAQNDEIAVLIGHFKHFRLRNGAFDARVRVEIFQSRRLHEFIARKQKFAAQRLLDAVDVVALSFEAVPHALREFDVIHSFFPYTKNREYILSFLQQFVNAN